MKLKCDEPLSNFAFNSDLRRYNKEAMAALELRKALVTNELLALSSTLADNGGA